MSNLPRIAAKIVSKLALVGSVPDQKAIAAIRVLLGIGSVTVFPPEFEAAPTVNGPAVDVSAPE
jgi:hypothetical protein